MCGIAYMQGVGGIVRAVEQLLHLDVPTSSGSDTNSHHGGLPYISSTKGATGHLLGGAGMQDPCHPVIQGSCFARAQQTMF